MPKKKISKSTYEFSKELFDSLDLENYVGSLEKVEKVGKSRLRLTISIPLHKDVVDPLIKAIERCRKKFSDGNDVVIIPSRRWYAHMIVQTPAILAKLLAGAIQNEERQEPSYIG